jgi:hypothetical protein
MLPFKIKYVGSYLIWYILKCALRKHISSTLDRNAKNEITVLLYVWLLEIKDICIVSFLLSFSRATIHLYMIHIFLISQYNSFSTYECGAIFSFVFHQSVMAVICFQSVHVLAIPMCVIKVTFPNPIHYVLFPFCFGFHRNLRQLKDYRSSGIVFNRNLRQLKLCYD